MSEEIVIANTISIRNAGFDEFWLQEQICKNPSALKLGELEVVAKEKIQSCGGRLDILLKDAEDDTMYEVEVMLGETDETHIIRTIEYWDNEKRKYPQRQHFAVLVAESITRRYFNVIQLFSHAIPIIAVQANMIEVGGRKSLHFSKVLDTYEEPEDPTPTTYEIYDEDKWRQVAPWMLEAANTMLEIISPIFPAAKLHYVKNYVAIEIDGDNCIWFFKRGGNKSSVEFWFGDKILPQAAEELDKSEISYVKKSTYVKFTIDSKAIRNHAPTVLKLAELLKLSLGE